MRPKLLLGDKDSQLEEYRFLVQNFLTRANTANNFWITGFATATASLYAIYERVDSSKILIFALVLMSTFNWSMAWQLEEITKIRTYMRIILEKRLRINWEQSWYYLSTTSKMARRSRRETIYIFIVPYAFIVFCMFYLNITKGAFHCRSTGFFLLMIFSTLIYLGSTIWLWYVYSSFSFKKYIKYWKDILRIMESNVQEEAERSRIILPKNWTTD